MEDLSLVVERIKTGTWINRIKACFVLLGIVIITSIVFIFNRGSTSKENVQQDHFGDEAKDKEKQSNEARTAANTHLNNAEKEIEKGKEEIKKIGSETGLADKINKWNNVS